jgi:hypothetical protein
MTNAKRVNIPVTFIPPDKIHLELSLDEAQVIYDISLCVGGCARTSRRGLTDGIGLALKDAGITRNESPFDDMHETQCRIFFKNRPENFKTISM